MKKLFIYILLTIFIFTSCSTKNSSSNNIQSVTVFIECSGQQIPLNNYWKNYSVNGINLSIGLNQIQLPVGQHTINFVNYKKDSLGNHINEKNVSDTITVTSSNNDIFRIP